MTIPTQAQIEAAAQVMFMKADGKTFRNKRELLELAKIALMAAAGVSEQ